MSFEGYYQVICANGHAATRELYGLESRESECTFCNAKIKWYNLVDQTNGCFSDDGKTRIDGKVQLRRKMPAKIKKCRSCGHKEVVKFETYQIPRTKGHMIHEQSKRAVG